MRLAFADVDLTDPCRVFAFGLAYGAALEAERRDAEDDQQCRAALAGTVADVRRRGVRVAVDGGGLPAATHPRGTYQGESTS